MKRTGKTLVRLKRFDREEQERNRRSCDGAKIILLLCFAILIARLCHLQLVLGEELSGKSESNRLRTVRLQAPRGKILDRHGRLLAGVKPSYNICLVREDIKNIEGVLARLAPLLGESEAEIRTRLALGKRQPLYEPIVIKRGVDWETLSRIEANRMHLPGVTIEVTPGRRYPYGPVAPHLVGYLGEVSRDDLSNNRYPGAQPGDLVGKRGVEARYNKELSGISGKRKISVDAFGHLVHVVDERPPVPGDDIYLTIDLDLQRIAEDAMNGLVGALVALDPRDGRILAAVSSPGFDPGSFSRGLSKKEWDKLNDELTRPLRNKIIQSCYAPGSTFKIVTAAAALQEGVVGIHDRFTCRANFKLGRSNFRCWDWRGHGETDLYKALVESCDVYFYKVGLKLGIDRIARYAEQFGLGSPTGIELPGEASGLVPTKKWKFRKYQEPWQDGETVQTAIGQGAVVVTPLQMARLTAAVANGGTLYRPVYIEQITDPSGKVISTFDAIPQGRLPVSRRHLAFIKKALTGVVEDKRGTGKFCRLDDVPVAGKTGTAQVVRQKRRREDKKMDWKYRDNAWFIAYAPADKPELAVAVLAEHAGHGGSAAAPIARKVFERWFQIQSPRPGLKPERTARKGPQGTVRDHV